MCLCVFKFGLRFFLRLLSFCFKVCFCHDLRCARVACVLFLNLGCGVFFFALASFLFLEFVSVFLCIVVTAFCVCLSFAFCSVLSMCEVLVAFHINIHRKHKTPEEGSNSP